MSGQQRDLTFQNFGEVRSEVESLLRLGYKPTKVFAILYDIVTHRQSANGEEVACDTFDNAVLAMRAKSPDDKR